MTLGACSGADSSGETAHHGAGALYEPHLVDGRFLNPWRPSSKRPAEVLRFALGRSPYDSTAPIEVPVVANDGRTLAGRAAEPRFTWIGQAGFAIHEGDQVILTDPHFGPRALWPRRKVAPGIPLSSVPPDAFAMISHNHYDHLDAYAVDRLAATVAWFVPLGLGEWFRDRGRFDVTELDWWQTAERDGWRITCLPSQHWSRRIGQSTNSTLWCSWLMDSGTHRYYFAGDTGYFPGLREIGRRFAPIDVALLPIGAYEPRWFMSYHHMNPHEAFAAFRDLGARYVLPMHWGTFDLTYEPIDYAAEVWREIVAEAADSATDPTDPARAPLLAIGETWRLPPRPAPAETAASPSGSG